jgi:hypothetical protein
MTARAEWEAALRLAAERGLVPAEAVAHAREALAARPAADLVTPALVAFWLDLPEGAVADLLAASAPTVTEELSPPASLGAYELTARLGEGGMGRVYRARDVTLGRDVALKLLSPALAAEPEARRRFLREARALAALDHPHVVRCYAAGEVPTPAGDRPFIAMELLPGGDAHALARAAGGRLDERRALEVCRDAARGLVALSSAGLVHRDVKPTNLLLAADGRVKLGDLGLARRRGGEDRLTLTGVAVGTLGFMAPEQLEGAADLDARADVYALGATLLALLTGAAPRPGAGPPVDLEARRPDLSPRTRDLVRRAMHRDRARRPDPGALLAALEEALTALEPSRIEALRATRSPRRRGWRLPASVALLLASPLVAVGWLATRPARASVALDVAPANGVVTRLADGRYAAAPTGDWSRAGLFDRERRQLPLHVRWTCEAAATRDSTVVAEWERGQGFRERAGFFYELGLRTSNAPIDAGAQVEPGGWWVTLQVRADGRVLGLVRQVSRGPSSPEVAILDRFELAGGGPVVLDATFDAAGWRLAVARAGRATATSARAWSFPPEAPITDEQAQGVYLWGHLGAWSDGRGSGTVRVDLVE